MGSPELLMLTRKYVKQQIADGYRPVVVVSAFKGVTDELVTVLDVIKSNLEHNRIQNIDEIILDFVEGIDKNNMRIVEELDISDKPLKDLKKEMKKILNEISDDLHIISKFGVLEIFEAKILAYGEKLSSIVYREFLESGKIGSMRLTGEELGIFTNENFLDGNIQYEKSVENIKNKIEKLTEVPVITGFIGRTESGQTTTLGRGGSDTTACFIGNALNAENVILWKEVEGVLSADPRIVKDAKTIEKINYAEAEESGKVICDKAIKYLEMKKIKAEVAYIREPSIKTKIVDKLDDDQGVKIVSSKGGLTLFKLKDGSIDQYGFLYRVSRIFNHNGINMVLIRNTRESMYIVVENKNKEKIKNAAEELSKNSMEVKMTDVSMVTVIGSMQWKDVNIFNEVLLDLNGKAELGAFPYKNSIRLEAVVSVVEASEVSNIIKTFHKKFIK